MISDFVWIKAKKKCIYRDQKTFILPKKRKWLA